MSTITSDLAEAVRNFRMPERAKHLLIASNPLVISGVTASGKTTVIKNLLKNHENFKFVVSHTTRHPRKKGEIYEIHGENYYFVSEQEMLDMISHQEFIEVKKTHHGWFYGKSATELDKIMSIGKMPVFDIDAQGAVDFVKVNSEIRPIFLLPPSYNSWTHRLDSVGGMSDIERAKKLRNAKNEIQIAVNNRHFILLVNHEAESTVTDIIRGFYKNPQHQHEAYHLALDYLQFLKNY